jgi:hypothetical protein
MKLKQAFTKISLKLILTVGVVTIGIISVYSFLSIQAQRNELLSQTELYANKLSETIRNSTHLSMLENRSDQTHNIINTIAQEPGLQEIRIFNKEGKIIFSSQKEFIGEMVDQNAEVVMPAIQQMNHLNDCRWKIECVSTILRRIPPGFLE